MTLYTEIFPSDAGGSAYLPSPFLPLNFDAAFSLDNGGSGVLKDIITTNTYQTVFEFTGKGILQALALFDIGTFAGTTTTKITIDGVAVEFVKGSFKFETYCGIWCTDTSAFVSIQTLRLMGVETIPFETSVKVETKSTVATVDFQYTYKFVKVV